MDGQDLQADADLAEESSCCLLHDLRNLMCVISHQSEMGHLARHLDAAELRAILGRIHQAARTAIELIEGEADTCAVPERFDVRSIVERVAEVAQGRGGEGTRVRFSLPSDPVWITGSPEACLRVCLNLALNAVDASAGEVSLSVSPESELPDAADLAAGVVPSPPCVTVSVCDDGPGIPAGLRDRIWDHGVSTKGANGSGEGLALVRRLVEEAGAGVTLDTGCGGRTCFHVYWPVSPEGTVNLHTRPESSLYGVTDVAFEI